MATTKVSKGLIKDEAITIEKLNNALVVTEAEGILNNDNDTTIPTSAAVKDYVDSTGVQSVVAGENVTVDNTDPLNPIVNSIQATVAASEFVFIEVKNQTGSTIPLGTGCMAVGTNGNSGQILIAPMIADGSVEAMFYIGVLEETLANGEIGRVVTQGEVNQINTNAYQDGDVLWCDPINPGTFTVTEPSAPNLKLETAIVLNASTNGKIFVRVQGNEGLHQLHDVGITSQTNKQGITWDSALGYWKNTNITNSTSGANSTFINTTTNVSTGDVTITSSLNATGTPDSTTFLRGDNQWTLIPISTLQQVTDLGNVTTNSITIESLFLNDASVSNGVIYYDNVEDRVTLANYNIGGSVYIETNGGSYVAKFNSDTSTELTGNLTVGGTATANSFISNGGTSSDFLKADGSLDSNSYALAGNYITSLTGEATASGPGASAVTLTNSAVIGKTISGVNITGGTIAATDTILTAFGKLQNQINGLIGSTKYEGVWDASTNTPTITSGSGTDGSYYIVNVAGTTNIDGISDWSVGDWIIFHDTAWQKVDNTDAVVSVNGQTGAVSLTTSNINEGTNLYYTDARVNANSNVTANTAARHSAVTIGTANGLGLSGQQISLGLASTSTTGALSSTDWNSFNDKTDNTGTVTSVTVNSGSGLSGSGTVTSTGTITLSHADTSSQGSVNNSGATVVQDVTLDTYGHVTGLASKTITLADLGYTGATNANYITNNNQLTNGAGYTTNVGDITGVTAGSGISGGGTSGTVTVSHADTSSQGSVNNSGNTVIQDVTLDTYGHVTGLVSANITSVSGNAGTSTTFSTSRTNYKGNTDGAVAGQLMWKEYGNNHTIFDASDGTSPSGTSINNSNPTNAWTTTYPTLMGWNGSGTYGVKVDRARYCDTATITGVTAGNGLTGGGTGGTVTLNVVGTNGLTVSADAITLDSDLRGHAWLIGRDNNDYYYVNTTNHEWRLDGALDMLLENDGDLHVDGDVIAYSTTTSDRRLKDNIKTIENALDKVEQLRGVEYDWNKGSRKGQHEIGLIAQEVEEVFPFLVKEKVKTTGDFENDDTAYKSVDYEKLIGVLIESVKELSAKVKTLEAKLQ